MEEKDFEAKLAKLTHHIDQLDAKLDDKISSLREELSKEISARYLAQIRDTSLAWLMPLSDTARHRAYDEIGKLAKGVIETLTEVSADEFEKNVLKFKDEINVITRAAGLGEIWGKPQE